MSRLYSSLLLLLAFGVSPSAYAPPAESAPPAPPYEAPSPYKRPWYNSWVPTKDEPLSYTMRGLVLAPHDVRLSIGYETSATLSIVTDIVSIHEQDVFALSGAWSPISNLELGLGAFTSGRYISDGPISVPDHAYVRYRYLNTPVEGAAELGYDIVEKTLKIAAPFRYHVSCFLSLTLKPSLAFNFDNYADYFGIEAELAVNPIPALYVAFRPQVRFHLSDPLIYLGGDILIGGTFGSASPIVDLEASIGLDVYETRENVDYSGFSGRLAVLARVHF